MREVLLLLYAAAVGFAAAGIAGSFYQLITARPPRFPSLSGGGLPSILATWLVCALTGPFIVAGMLVVAWRAKRPPLGWCVAGVAVAGLWSSCSGVVVLQFVIAFWDGIA